MTTIFLHIPKTGGTSARHAMKRSLDAAETCFVYRGEKRFTQPDELLAMGREAVDRFRFVCGHFDHQFALSVPCSERRLATVLRSPVMRALSLYRHRMIHQLKRQDLSVSEVLEHNLIRQLHNNQTRIVSGIELEPGGCNDRILGVAQHNLATCYGYIGFTETMEIDTPGELARLGLPEVQQQRLNRTGGNTGLPPVTWADIEALADANRFDLALYRFALAVRRAQSRRQMAPLPSHAVARLMQRDAPNGAGGRLGAIRGGIVRGWASNGCETVPEVVLFVRNHRGAIVHQTASVHRPDVLVSGPGDNSQCGFSADIRKLLDGACANDTIHAYALSTMRELANSPIRVADAS